MKALIRHPGETITENDGVEGIDWETGYPLTNAQWFGGPYALIEDYIPPQYDENGEELTISDKEKEITELRARLAALEKDL